MIGDPQEGAFRVWAEDEEASAGRLIGPAGTAARAAELRAREDWLAGEKHWPRTYLTRCDATGTISSVEVTLAMQPSFVTIATRKIPMTPATHVLWGGSALCEDRRLAGMPRDWPADQRWISLKDVADGAVTPSDGCSRCWLKVPDLVTDIKQIGADR